MDVGRIARVLIRAGAENTHAGFCKALAKSVGKFAQIKEPDLKTE